MTENILFGHLTNGTLLGIMELKMMRYTAVRNGTDLKGLQIILFDKQGKTTQEISYSYPPDIEFANNLDVLG